MRSTAWPATPPPPEARRPRFATALLAVVTFAYPFLVYAALGRVEPRWLALLLLALALLRAWARRSAVWLAAAGATALLAAAAALGNQLLPLKLYPALVNAALLLVFGASLLRPPTVVERLARLREPQLPPAAVAYTRRVTQLWCAFFVVNGALAFATARWASDAVWALYNGLIAYLAIGALFAAEWCWRRRLRARRAAEGAHG